MLAMFVHLTMVRCFYCFRDYFDHMFTIHSIIFYSDIDIEKHRFYERLLKDKEIPISANPLLLFQFLLRRQKI